jgi:hypothetical protein
MDNNNTQQDQLNLLLAKVAELTAENEALKSTKQPPPLQSKKTKATESPYTTPTSTPVMIIQGLRDHARSKFTKRSPGTLAAAAESAAAAAAAAAAPNSSAATTLNQQSKTQQQTLQYQMDILAQMNELKIEANKRGIEDEVIKNNLFVQNVSRE